MTEAQTLEEFAESSVALYAICEGCTHMAGVDVIALAEAVGWRPTRQEVQRRLRCSRCGSRDGRQYFGPAKPRLWHLGMYRNGRTR